MKEKCGIRFVLVLVACIGVALTSASGAQSQNDNSLVFIDASKPPSPPKPLPFVTGGKSPDGHELSANSRYLMRDGTPWFPVMGEFHFARFPESGWEEEILKMKAGGVQIVSTYIFWIHHEEIEGQFDWTSQRNLRRFVELCAKHGMYVWIRVGPWAHGEARNGGLPDWLIQKYPTRQNDADYLRYVERFYEQIGQQTKGLFWKDGGPIIGIQIENEYHGQGSGKGAEHMLTLLRIARETGLDAPFYTATAWDAAEVPAQQFLPVFGGYGDAFWSRRVDELPPNANYFFTAICCDENVGDDLRSKRPDLDARYAHYPFLTAELGGGMELSYHRRPLMSSDDVVAMMLVKLGSGVTLTGYYMFHGGTNPEGKRTTLQESQATGYPNDLPVKSYDFQAPLGEFGQENSSFRDLKVLHLFLRDFGSLLAPMSPYLPASMPTNRSDTSTPRVAARFEKNRGFLFINNYQRLYPLPTRKNFQVRVKTILNEITVPRHPVEIPTGAYTIWPVNLDMGGALLEYSTAQLLCKLDTPDTYVFFAWPGLPVEFAFSNLAGETIEAPHGRIVHENGRVYVDQLEPGEEAAIHIRKPDGESIQILLLSRETARNLWKAPVGGRQRLVLSAANVYFDENALHLSATNPAELKFGILPNPSRIPTFFKAMGADGLFTQYGTQIDQVKIEVKVAKHKDAILQPPPRISNGVAEAPDAAAFEGAAEWAISVPAITSPSVQNIFLRISYEGDVARVYANDRLLTDDFYKGTPIVVGLRRISSQGVDPHLQLRILPMRKDAPIYVASSSRLSFPASGQAVALKTVEAIPEYQAVADLDQ